MLEDTDTLFIYSMVFFGAYLLLLVWKTIGRLHRPSPTASEFYIADRSLLGPWAILSLWATFFSAGTFVGGTGFFYAHGIGSLYFSLAQYLLMGVVIYVIGVKVWRKAKIEGDMILSPISVLLGENDRPLLHWLIVACTIFFLLPYITLQISAVGKLLASTIGIVYWVAILIVVISFMAYSLVGGLKSVVLTDVVQSIITIIGVTITALIIFWDNWDFSFIIFLADIHEADHSDILSLPGPHGFFSFPMLFALAISFGLMPITQPQMSVRFMSAKGVDSIKRMAVLFPFLGILAIIPPAIFGLGGAALFPELTSGDEVLGMTIRSIPAFLGAAVLLGIVAATMSTADSVFLAFGNIVSQAMTVRNSRDRRIDRVKIGRLMMIVAAIVSLPASINPPDLVAKLAILSAAGTLSLAPLLIFSIFEVKIPYAYCVVAVITGFLGVFVTTWFDLPISPVVFPPALIGFTFALLTMILGVIHQQIIENNSN